MLKVLGDLIRFQYRFLTFQTTREELMSVGTSHLIWGLLFTWLAGVGRWWDDPNAKTLQMLGVGSLVYVLLLTTLLWILVRPLGAPDWKFVRVATLLMFTSPLALIYAIPVERFVDIDTAIRMNVTFLAVVATWRVFLYVMLLRRLAGFDSVTTLVTCLLPLMGIVATLYSLNLHQTVFDIMGGLREQTKGPHDFDHQVLFLLTGLSFIGVIPFLLAYLVLMAIRRQQKRETQEQV